MAKIGANAPTPSSQHLLKDAHKLLFVNNVQFLSISIMEVTCRVWPLMILVRGVFIGKGQGGVAYNQPPSPPLTPDFLGEVLLLVVGPLRGGGAGALKKITFLKLETKIPEKM